MTPADLMRAAAMAVVRKLMAGDDVLRLVAVADALEAAAGEEVSIGAAQALMDLKSARLRLDPPLLSPVEDDWTAEDDCAVAAGQVAELLDAMSLEQIERVLAVARAVARPVDIIRSIDTTRRPALHLQIKAQDFVEEVRGLASVEEIEGAVAAALASDDDEPDAKT